MTAPQLLTEAEAAEALRLHSRTLRKARQDGELHFVKIGSSIRYSPSDLARFIESKRICASTKERGRPSGGTPSPHTVFDFEEARAKRASAKRS
ncbi:helix-turn-helix domain-containing protein [Erythrobacter sp. HA6-11]